MQEYKTLLGGLGAIIALLAYAIYFHDIFFRHTKPHAFSWLVWTLLAGIGFAAQVTGGAGAGSWVLGVDVIVCSVIFVVALWKGERGYVWVDWISLALALFSIVLWRITGTPLLSVILICCIDALAYVPTFRKSFFKPQEESMTAFMLFSLKFILVLLALERYSIVTALYPAWIIILNVGFVGMLLWGRRVS
ncbi:hypothetical protein A3C37_05560 [Candidatus Peribacteria bacterium RIFCSPHIGHO2_02_FULL_53_20]|nr:MAG: hypothetical protein A3C37_05560 [Candidatus Peribacteria bacterium RIFCSPHIGHO2_02_FULL_53_20]OGJ66936.1 MAG: hypothetical protein A3B61_01350 [Candidatus Peribacteria bacterium RIFCSPLOWO2_01_FULL_53_10]OGJ73867.1 MAG: hypothetical protein A3G69_04310 [Candidatus Peribacteria bacterium RIFCSPLOWO2_12_FULL_53_10]